MPKANFPVTTAVEHKPRLAVLDGLRGVAALAVLLFHGRFWLPKHVFGHGYLAVDFFFMLSGFVIPYAYGRKLETGGISKRQFVRERLIRLYPLTLLSAALAAIPLLLGVTTGHVSAGPYTLLQLFALAALAVPAPHQLATVPFPLNGPTWSISAELCANAVYLLIRAILRPPILALLILASAVGEAFYTIHYGTIGGFGPTFMPGLGLASRITFPFSIGMVLYLWKRSRSYELPTWVALGLAVALFGALALPEFKGGAPWFDMAAIWLLFPGIVAASLNTRLNARAGQIAEVSAAMSFPLYALHYPLVRSFDLLQQHYGWPWRERTIGFLLVAAIACLLAAGLAPIDEWTRKRLKQALPGLGAKR